MAAIDNVITAYKTKKDITLPFSKGVPDDFNLKDISHYVPVEAMTKIRQAMDGRQDITLPFGSKSTELQKTELRQPLGETAKISGDLQAATVQPEVQPAEQTKQPTYLENLAQTPQRIAESYKTAVGDIEKSITEGSKRMQLPGALNKVRGGVQAGLGTAGAVAGATFAPVVETVRGILPQTESELVNAITTGAGVGTTFGGGWGSIIGGLMGAGFYTKEAIQNKLLDNPTIKNFIAKNPDVIPDIDNAIMVGLSAVGGKKLAGKPQDILSRPVSKAPGLVGKNIVEAATLPIQLTGKALKTIGERQIAKDTKLVNELAGKVSQGEIKDIPKVKKALHEIDIEGIKTFDDLSKTLGSKIENLSTKVDDFLSLDKNPRQLKDLTAEIKIDNKTVKHNYVVDAVKQLKEFYSKTNDVENLTKTLALEKQIKTQGLTLREVNDLARIHGRELKGYNDKGELASGLTKQAAENTRSGLKQTARQKLGLETVKTTDETISNLMRTQDLIDTVNERVNKLKSVVTKRGVGEGLGRLAFNLVDTLTGKGLSGFMRAGFIPRGGGLKTMNALDLEKGLSKYLKQLNDLEVKLSKPNRLPENLVKIGGKLEGVGRIPENLKPK